MKLDRVKKALVHASHEQLSTMREWITIRMVYLEERECQQRADAKWMELQPLVPGDSLFVHGGPMYQGRIWRYTRSKGFTSPSSNDMRVDISKHTLFVRIVQPRARRVWVETSGEALGHPTTTHARIGFCMTPDMLSGHDVRKVPTASQVTEAILQENDEEEIPF